MSETPTSVAETTLRWTYLPLASTSKQRLVIAQATTLSRLIDAGVQLKGVLRLNLDATGQPRSAELAVQSAGDLRVLEPARDPAQIPQTTVAAISSGVSRIHRIRLRGELIRGGQEFIFMDSTGSIPLRPNLLHDPVPGSALDIVAYASRENGVAILTEGQLVADATVAATRRPVLHGPTKVVPFQDRALAQALKPRNL